MRLTTQEDIKKLGRILSVWAHPDDETFTSGGLIAAANENGQFTMCVTMTRGAAGVQDTKRWPPERLAEIRTKELEAALKILGTKHFKILDYNDGDLDKVSEKEGVALVAELIKTHHPDTIITFGPDGLTGHTDHQTVSKWVKLAVEKLEAKPAVFHAVELKGRYEGHMKQLDETFNIFFNIDQPLLKSKEECDIYFELPPEIADKKTAALSAHVSQLEKLMEAAGENIQAVFGAEGFIRSR